MVAWFIQCLLSCHKFSQLFFAFFLTNEFIGVILIFKMGNQGKLNVKKEKEGNAMASKYVGMTADQMKRAIEAEEKAFEATTWSDGYLIADLRKAFEKVENQEHWKNPVNFLVGSKVLEKWEKEEGITLDMIDTSITYFQGCVAKINHNVSYVYIKSPGYVC